MIIHLFVRKRAESFSSDTALFPDKRSVLNLLPVFDQFYGLHMVTGDQFHEIESSRHLTEQKFMFLFGSHFGFKHLFTLQVEDFNAYIAQI